jgi:hypothetical protein
MKLALPLMVLLAQLLISLLLALSKVAVLYETYKDRLQKSPH